MKRLKAKKRISAQCGFTLIEAMVALGIMSVVMAGVMDLFVGSLRLAARSTAEVNADLDSSRALHHVIQETREALWLGLPGDSDGTLSSPTSVSGIKSFLDGAYYNIGSTYGSKTAFQSVDPTNTYTVDTAIYLCQPGTATNVTVGLSSGTSTFPPSGTPFYNRNAQGSGILIYRADDGGTPDGQNGRCLYEQIGQYNASTNPPVKIINIAQASPAPAPAWNAVQFSRSVDSSNNVLNYDVEIKIISNYYSPINAHQTNESTSSSSDTALVGKCVYMRNHETGSSTGHSGTIQPATPAGGNRFRPS